MGIAPAKNATAIAIVGVPILLDGLVTEASRTHRTTEYLRESYPESKLGQSCRRFRSSLQSRSGVENLSLPRVTTKSQASPLHVDPNPGIVLDHRRAIERCLGVLINLDARIVALDHCGGRVRIEAAYSHHGLTAKAHCQSIVLNCRRLHAGVGETIQKQPRVPLLESTLLEVDFVTATDNSYSAPVV